MAFIKHTHKVIIEVHPFRKHKPGLLKANFFGRPKTLLNLVSSDYNKSLLQWTNQLWQNYISTSMNSTTTKKTNAHAEFYADVQLLSHA